VNERRLAVSVIGDARLEDSARIEEAERLGDALVRAGFRVVTGGLGGVMEAVSRGARRSPAWEEGRVVGILPSYRKSDANPWCDIVIPTGLQLGRNILVAASGDVIIAIGGGSGTLSEMALAWQLGRPLIALGARGWAGRLAGEPLDERGSMPVRACPTVEEAVAACLELGTVLVEAGDIGSGWRKAGSAT
jgi:uncharacterized protein (TIGR00725 family)